MMLEQLGRHLGKHKIRSCKETYSYYTSYERKHDWISLLLKCKAKLPDYKTKCRSNKLINWSMWL